MKGDDDAALPHLEKSFTRNWIARAMLAVARYRARDLAGAIKVFEEAAKANKKEALLWQVYAWVLEKEGRHEDGDRACSGAAVAANASDEKLKGSLQALQNGKKLKLGKLYAEQWFQFRLEAVPQALDDAELPPGSPGHVPAALTAAVPAPRPGARHTPQVPPWPSGRRLAHPMSGTLALRRTAPGSGHRGGVLLHVEEPDLEPLGAEVHTGGVGIGSGVLPVNLHELGHRSPRTLQM